MARSALTIPRLGQLPQNTHSVEFNGIDQIAETTDNMGLSGSAAVSFGGWFKLLTSITANGAAFISLGTFDSFNAGIGPLGSINAFPFNNSLYGPYFNPSGLSADRINVDTWVHIAYTYAGGTNGETKMYINGKLVLTSTVTAIAVDGHASIGAVFAVPFASYLYTNAKYGPAFAYTDVLTLEEIEDIYASQIYPTDNVKALWLMTEGSGQTIADSSGNGFDLICNTAPIWSASDLPMPARTPISQARLDASARISV